MILVLVVLVLVVVVVLRPPHGDLDVRGVVERRELEGRVARRDVMVHEDGRSPPRGHGRGVAGAVAPVIALLVDVVVVCLGVTVLVVAFLLFVDEAHRDVHFHPRRRERYRRRVKGEHAPAAEPAAVAAVVVRPAGALLPPAFSFIPLAVAGPVVVALALELRKARRLTERFTGLLIAKLLADRVGRDPDAAARRRRRQFNCVRRFVAAGRVEQQEARLDDDLGVARPRRQARDPARCAVRGVGTYILPSPRHRGEHRADPRVRRAPPRRREKAGSETGISPFACDFSALRAQKPYACDLGP